MKIIYNRYFPLKPFLATNIFGIIFCRGKEGRLSEVDKNHEYIHTLQQRELFYIIFTIWYNIEWLYGIIKYRSIMKAYYNISFEREAYAMERNLQYRDERKTCAWYQYVGEKSIVREVVDFFMEITAFVRDDFKWTKYTFAAIVAICMIVGQIYFNIYDVLLAPSYKVGTSMICIPLFQVAVYFFVLLPSLLMHGEMWRMKHWQSWAFPILLVGIMGEGQAFNAFNEWIMNTDFYFKEKFYLQNVCSYLIRSVCIVSFLFLFRWATTGRFGLYGMTRSARYIKVYLLIFLVLLPMFIAVSTTPQFQTFYPRVCIVPYSGVFGWADWKAISFFELSYANDFLAVESLFRGALVVGLSKWLGARTVLPMALTYMSVHLGKPDLELCSSVIGGYFLGILAYRTQHLWGGIIIHLGIAMLFEVLGFIV